MRLPIAFFWDAGPNGNVDHLAENGVTPEEAEEVILARFASREPSNSTPEYWVVQGFTATRRYLLVVFEYLVDDGIVIPVTAFEPEEQWP